MLKISYFPVLFESSQGDASAINAEMPAFTQLKQMQYYIRNTITIC